MNLLPTGTMDSRRVRPTEIVFFLAILMNNEKVESIIVQRPSDKTAIVNESTYFNCSTSIRPVDDSSVTWFHFPLDARGDRVYVYDDGRIFPDYKNRFDIDKNLSSGKFDLVALRLQLTDAGRYECSDDILGSQEASAELTLLESELVCKSGVDPGGGDGPTQCDKVIAPDELQLSCSVQYNGRNSPKMLWRKIGNSSTQMKTNCATKDNRVTCNASLAADLQQNRSVHYCELTTTHQYNCSPDIPKLSYVFSGNETVKIAVDEEVKCSANSSQLCSYKWKWFSGSDLLTVSTDQTLKPTRDGSHRCEATCSIGNTSCTVNVMFAEVYSIKATTGQLYMWSLGLIVLFILATIILVVLYVYWRRKRAKDGSSTVAGDELATKPPEDKNAPPRKKPIFIGGSVTFSESIFKEINADRLCIGMGTFGHVFGPCDWNNRTYAIKKRIFGKDIMTNDALGNHLIACGIWISLRHRNLITVQSVSFDSPALYILMEYAAGGSLKKVLEQIKSDLPLEIQKDWGTQIAQGMAHLHQQAIVHRDLKSPNIVILEADAALHPRNKTLKITDFDQILERDCTTDMHDVGTYVWMAPEVIRQTDETFSMASDVWSYGVVLWEILTRNIPHKGLELRALMEKASQKQLILEIQDSCPEEIKEILIKCLHYDKSSRPSFHDIQRVLQNPHDQLLKQWVEEKSNFSNSSAIKFKVNTNTTTIDTRDETTDQTYEKTSEEASVGEINNESNVENADEESYEETYVEETNKELIEKRTEEANVEAAIILNRAWLEDHIGHNSRLMDILCDNGTLSWREVFTVKLRGSYSTRNARLLDYVIKKRQGNRLIAALQHTEQQHVVDDLMGKKVSDAVESQFENFAELSSLKIITDQDMVDKLTINQYFIDRGTSGAIYGPFIWKDKKCSIKQIIYSPDKITAERIAEITQLRDRCMELNHRHLVKVFEVWFLLPALYVLMEYAEGRSLDKILRPKDVSAPLTPFSNDVVQDWALQIADGMQYLHEKKLVHRNLKTAHVLVMESADVLPNTLKIGSYTLAREHDHSTVMSLKGTMAWMAPEYIRGEEFSTLSDVWSYGVTVWEILTRDVPYKEIKKETDLVRAAINKTLKLKIPESCPERLRTLLTDCWSYDVKKRPSFTEICDCL